MNNRFSHIEKILVECDDKLVGLLTCQIFGKSNINKIKPIEP